MGEHPFLSVATVATVSTVLLLFGAFLLVLANLSAVLDRWGKDVQISCYLRDGIREEQVFVLKAALEAQPEVSTVVYIAKDEALERFADSLEGIGPILADLDQNPLPASLELRLHPQFQEPRQVAAIAERLRRPEFEDMDWSREWVERFHGFVALLRLSGIVLGALLLLAAVFLVANTIRLAIYARRDELSIIALVGGTRWFARAPFLIEGAIHGLLGGALSLGMLLGLYRYAFVQVQDSLGMILGAGVPRFLPGSTSMLLPAAGLLVGVAGALASVLQNEEEGLAA
jgi:cell division transport system permease protein